MKSDDSSEILLRTIDYLMEYTEVMRSFVPSQIQDSKTFREKQLELVRSFNTATAHLSLCALEHSKEEGDKIDETKDWVRELIKAIRLPDLSPSTKNRS